MTLHVYIGFDAIDHLAYRVCESSILDQTKADVEIHPLRDWQLRHEGFYWRSWMMLPSGQKKDVRDQRGHSTEFSYTRFLTPLIHRKKRRKGPALFLDADMMFRADIGELFELADDRFDVQCVHHEYKPEESVKIVGVKQEQYERKNWSSVMLFPNPARISAPPSKLTIDNVNERGRDWLHQMRWADSIGQLPEEWNWLEGWSSKDIVPKNVHFTRGTPDLPDWGAVDYAFEYWKWADLSGWRGHNIL